MSYSIQLTPEVEEKIAGWNLTKRLLDEIRFRLPDDLGENPAAKLYTVPNDPDYMEYSFSTDGGELDREHLFVFRVVYSRDRIALVILDCDHISVLP